MIGFKMKIICLMKKNIIIEDYNDGIKNKYLMFN